jgi:hypothetical protein
MNGKWNAECADQVWYINTIIQITKPEHMAERQRERERAQHNDIISWMLERREEQRVWVM